MAIGPEAIAFIIPLMGWMPTAVDLSTWNSLWTIEKIKSSGYHPKLKETLFDFNLGYIVSALLSICFITLGAFLIYGTDLTIAKQSDLFASDVVGLYTRIFGSWSYVIIASCTFSIMFGTCIAVFDGYGRALKRTTELLFLNQREYLEVETPILQPIPGGAIARPFLTHHNALNIPLYLRISNELYLKRLIVGGFDGVYEFAKDFRNEGMDRTHNPEFTILELYVSYKDYHWMMDMTEKLLEKVALDSNGKTNIKVGEKSIDFKAP